MADSGQTYSNPVLSIIQAWLPVLTVVVGAGWALWTYLGHQNEVASQTRDQLAKDIETRRIEARRPFLEKQLALYFEAAQVAGKLVTIPPDDKEWAGVERRFWELYWSELSMVEDQFVEDAMVKFGDQLDAYKKTKDKGSLNGAANGLAHAIRKSIESGWGKGQPGDVPVTPSASEPGAR